MNVQIDGNEMIFHDYADIGIAVSSPKGLMVPVVRNAEQMTLAQIEAFTGLPGWAAFMLPRAVLT